MIHTMNLQDKPFNSIKKGTKTIELRLYDEKRQKIKIGDIIEFNNNYNNEIIRTKVVKIYVFDSFTDLYNSLDKISIGYSDNEESQPSDMEKYYTKDDINKYGVVGIEVKLI